MIELSYSMAFTLYLAITITLLLGVWLFQHYGSRKRKTIENERELFVCEYCHFAYLEKAIEQVNRCPQCNSFNKNNRYKK